MVSKRPAVALDVMLAAALLGLMAGVFEVAVIGFRHYVLHRFVMAGVDAVWMIPVASLLVLLMAALPLAALAWLFPSQVLPRLPVTVLGALAVFSMLSAFQEIHPYASVLLAVGVALRLGAFVSDRPQAWRRIVRRGTAGLVVLVGVIGAGNMARLRLRERRATREVAAQGITAPNILLLILDTVRARSLHRYGYARATSPRIDSLAAGGVTFDLALAPSSWTLPSHSSLFTNRSPGQLSGRWRRPFDGSVLTLAEALRDRGYHTAGFTANIIYTSRESGLAKGFTHYEGYKHTFKQLLLRAPLVQLGVVRQVMAAGTRRQQARALLRMDLARPFEPNSDKKTARDVRAALEAWLDRGQRPFFAFVNLFDAHDDNVPPAPFDTMFGPGEGRVLRYDRLVATMDHEIGVILDELARRGELDHTIVAVTADHGEHLGEHGLNSHGGSLYLEVLHVPLVMRYPPRIPAGLRVTGPVAMRAVGPTLFDLAGVAAAPEFATGSLVRRWQADPPVAEPVYSEVERLAAGAPRDPALRGAMRSIVAGDWHYIANGDGTQELYNYRLDPAEHRNVAHEEGAVLERLRALAFAVPSGY